MIFSRVSVPSSSTRARSRGARAGWGARAPLLAAIIALGAPAGALAQTAGGSAVSAPERRPGDYSGVTPGQGEQPPRARKARGAAPITWLGFLEQDGGGARVFVQSPREIAYDQSVVDGALVVHLAGARFAARNTARVLDTRFFDSAVREVRSKQVAARRARRGQPARRAGVEIVIEFKNPADAAAARASLQQEKDGYHYLYLDLGPGTASAGD